MITTVHVAPDISDYDTTYLVYYKYENFSIRFDCFTSNCCQLNVVSHLPFHEKNCQKLCNATHNIVIERGRGRRGGAREGEGEDVDVKKEGRVVRVRRREAMIMFGEGGGQEVGLVCQSTSRP